MRLRIGLLLLVLYHYHHYHHHYYYHVLQDTDGKCRYWGLEKRDPIDRFSLESVGWGASRAQVPYGDYGTPEKQIVSKLVSWKSKVIKANKDNRRGIYNQSFTLRISLDGVEPPVFRDIKCSAGVKLRTLSEKIIGPAMGWSLGVHAFLFTNPIDGSIYGQTTNRKGLDDSLLMAYHGWESISSEKVRLGDLVEKPGDILLYLYDLGVRWEHTITVLEVSSPPISGAHVVCIGGSGACPPEDGNGLDEKHPAYLCTSAQDNVLAIDTMYCDLNGNSVYNMSIAKGGCLSDKNHDKHSEKQKDAVEASNKEKLKLKVFDWNHFDLDATNDQLKIALEIHGASCLCCVEGLYLKKISLCAVCANANNLKHCSRCNAIAYCSQACQLSDWPKHKLECNELKIAAKEIRKRGEIDFATGKPGKE